MKQHTLNWLSYSFIILLLFSCKKKQKGVLDDFPPGNFDFVWITEHNGIKDTLKGEVSGPYPAVSLFLFRRKLILDEDESPIGLHCTPDYSAIDEFGTYPPGFTADVVSYQVNTNTISISFTKNDTLSGSFNLTRK